MDKISLSVKKFKELTKVQLKMLAEVHFNHWVKFNPKMDFETTLNKFQFLYTTDNLPYGLALFENNEIVGFFVLKKENLKKYPNIFPWLSDVMIIEKYRGKGYGKILIEQAENILTSDGFSKVYVWTDQAPEFYKKLGFVYQQEVEKNEGGFGQLFVKNL